MLLITYSSSFLKYLNTKRGYLTGFIIHAFSYIVAIIVKRSGIHFHIDDAWLLSLIMIVPFALAVILEKYRGSGEVLPLEIKLKRYFTSFLLSLGFISLVIIFFFPDTPSRLVVFGSLLISFILELSLLLAEGGFQLEKNFRLKIKFSFSNFIQEFIILVISFLLVLYAYKEPLPPISDYPFIYSSIILVWFIDLLLVHNFKNIAIRKTNWSYFWERLKSYILFILIYSFLLFAFNVDKSMQYMLVVFSLVYSFIALLHFSILLVIYKTPVHDAIKGSFRSIIEYKENIQMYPRELSGKYSSPNSNYFNPFLKEQLESVYLRKFPGIYDFLNNSLELTSFDFRKCVMIRSSDLYNVEILPESYFEFYMNLHEINDLPRLNEYFQKLNRRLNKGGYYVGRVEPTHLRFERFLKKYPYHIARFFYFFDFLWRRVTPNLPFLRRVYFVFSSGKKRAISFPEALGRLYYCGFEVCNYEPFGNFIYYVCRKVNEADDVGNPLYGPLIKLKRVGKGGKIFNVYKFRTMHPYSEFIQKFVYDKNNLAMGGKIKNDFRVTSWGKFLRKFWLDELPMLINWLRGDLKLVGVRPISEHYLSLYDKELQKLRIKYKPGILPPFYYDLPKTLDEIMESEKKYFTAYNKSPILTDLKYFFVILYNILIRKARSN